MAVVEAAKAIFANCDEMQAGSTLRLQICMGLHAGPAVAAVVGVQRPKWVMFGAALDIARTLRRMAVPSSILLSSEVESLLRVCLYVCWPLMVVSHSTYILIYITGRHAYASTQAQTRSLHLGICERHDKVAKSLQPVHLHAGDPFWMISQLAVHL